jgi:PAS domain S-box-containing protein
MLRSASRLQTKHDDFVTCDNDVPGQTVLAESLELTRAILDSAADSIVMIDDKFLVLDSSPGTERIFGFQREARVGQKAYKVVHSDDRLAVVSALERLFDDTDVLLNIRFRANHVDGRSIMIETRGRMVGAVEGVRARAVLISRDVSDAFAFEELLLAKRSEIDRRHEAHVSREARDKSTIVEVMRQMRPANTVQAAAGAFCEAVTRLSHFDAACVLLCESDGTLRPVAISGSKMIDINDGRTITPSDPERISKIINGPLMFGVDDCHWPFNPELVKIAKEEGLKEIVLAPVRWDGQLIGIFGFATRDPEARSGLKSRFAHFEELGLYAGTLLGAQVIEDKNRVMLHAELRDIIDNRRFHAVFQPFVELSTGTVVGYEALTRFDDGTRPDVRFIEAHSVGLGSELESVAAAAAIEAACDLEPHIFLSVNFSPAAILDGNAAATVANARRGIVVEITEHARIDNYAAVRLAVGQIDGCQLAVDDAGAGYTSLSHILQLHPNFVKLDISIVHGIDSNSARQAMAAGMCHFAAQTGTVIVAEGIETKEEADTLRELGAKLGRRGALGQGFFFGKPERLYTKIETHDTKFDAADLI